MTHTFTKTPDPYSDDMTDVTLKTEAESLQNVLLAFEDYLRGCGYHFDGKLGVVPDDKDDLP